MIKRVDKSEVRFNDDGTVDEIVIIDSKGNCLFHLEQMNDTCFWMAVYGSKSNESIHVNIFSKNGRSHLTAVDNS